MNDYMAAYHDAVLLMGQVMRNIVQNSADERQDMSVTYFRNTSFTGKKEREEEEEETGVFTLWSEGWNYANNVKAE